MSQANVNLQPIAFMLQLMRPARSSWGLLGDDWLANSLPTTPPSDFLGDSLRVRQKRCPGGGCNSMPPHLVCECGHVVPSSVIVSDARLRHIGKNLSDTFL